MAQRTVHRKLTCRFLLEHTRCRTVVDPFRGLGSLLAVANAHGLDAVGVECSHKRAERARTLTFHPGDPHAGTPARTRRR